MGSERFLSMYPVILHFNCALSVLNNETGVVQDYADYHIVLFRYYTGSGFCYCFIEVLTDTFVLKIRTCAFKNDIL